MNFKDNILQWYQQYKRNLPWRETLEPYRIWVSEIILQQTRVDQGLPYYLKFIEHFPDVKTLAEASEQEVLNVWKGLGYYSRARHMHYTAKDVITTFKGVFPRDYDSLIRLKGIGSYTAAAISSICNFENKPAIDGNVTRVISRYFGIPDAVGSSAMYKKVLWISRQLIPDDFPGDYNQSLMEYGATVCTPAAPKCDKCILSMSCYARLNNLTGILPVKKKSIVKRNRYFNYLHIVSGKGNVILKKRTGDDIWKNMWDFPLIESDRLLNIGEIDKRTILEFIGNENFVYKGMYDSIYILTHQTLHVRFITILAEDMNISTKNDYIIADSADTSYPLPRLIENFLKRNDIFFGYE